MQFSNNVLLLGHTCPFEVRCAYVTYVGGWNVSGGYICHFWVEATLPPLATVPSKAEKVHAASAVSQSSRAPADL